MLRPDCDPCTGVEATAKLHSIWATARIALEFKDATDITVEHRRGDGGIGVKVLQVDHGLLGRWLGDAAFCYPICRLLRQNLIDTYLPAFRRCQWRGKITRFPVDLKSLPD